MPTYEYACTECGRRFEISQRIADDPLTECEVCGGRLRKLFHPAGIVLKGSGFYRTDNRPARGGGEKKQGEKGSSGKQQGKGSGDQAKPGDGSKPKEKSA